MVDGVPPLTLPMLTISQLLGWELCAERLSRAAEELKAVRQEAAECGLLSPERKDSVGEREVPLDFWLVDLDVFVSEIYEAIEYIHWERDEALKVYGDAQ